MSCAANGAEQRNELTVDHGCEVVLDSPPQGATFCVAMRHPSCDIQKESDKSTEVAARAPIERAQGLRGLRDALPRNLGFLSSSVPLQGSDTVRP